MPGAGQRHDNEVVIPSSQMPPGGLTGRAAETAAIRRALGQSRLVTVTGLPGVGKTAAAIAAAGSGPTAANSYPDGIWLIRLDSLQDEALLPHTIAAAMRLPDTFDASPLAALIRELRVRRALILLDTCEHLLGSVAGVAAALGQNCPGMGILATSREPLRVPGEQTLTIAPLPMRDSVRLLGSRASGSFPLERDTLEEVCARLDGLPLAIELAARQLGSISPGGLLGALDEGFLSLLSDPDADVPRHRSMHAAIGWSHQLCTPAERLLWARLSVFDGAFRMKDCQEVCATTHLTDDAIAVGVRMLVERSILLPGAPEAPEAPEPAEPRFRMPVTIRAYGAGMLRRLAEDEEMRRRYRRWRGGPRRDAVWHLPQHAVAE